MHFRNSSVTSRNTGRVLVVDPDESSRKLARMTLELRGHVVLEAADVTSALYALGEQQVDVVLTELRVPGGGGTHLLCCARAEGLADQVAIIAVTGSTMRGDRERILGLGFDDHVRKPYCIDELSEAVTVALCDVRAGRPVDHEEPMPSTRRLALVRR